MAIDQFDDAFWNQFPTTGGVTGQPSVDPSQLGTMGTSPLMNPTAVPNSGVSGTGTPTTPGTVPGTPTAGGQVTMQSFNDAWLASPYPGTVDGLKQFMAAHPEYAAAGITLGGSKGDKVYGPGGTYWGDAIIAAGEGGKGKSGLSGPGAGGGAAGGGGSNLASLGYAFGSSMAPWTEQFKAPDPNQIANDPYYQFQLKEGMKGIQNSAAARGTLLTGGTLKGLENYGQGLASSFGDKAYDRGMGEYLLRRQNFYDTEDRPFAKNVTLANLGRPT